MDDKLNIFLELKSETKRHFQRWNLKMDLNLRQFKDQTKLTEFKRRQRSRSIKQK